MACGLQALLRRVFSISIFRITAIKARLGTAEPSHLDRFYKFGCSPALLRKPNELTGFLFFSIYIGLWSLGHIC